MDTGISPLAVAPAELLAMLARFDCTYPMIPGQHLQTEAIPVMAALALHFCSALILTLVQSVYDAR